MFKSMTQSRFNTNVIYLLVMALLFASALSPSANAAMVSTDSYLAQTQMAYDRQQLLALIDTDEIQQQLANHGVSPADAEARINAMTHAELLAFNDALQNAPAGEGLLSTLLVVFVVFVITDMLCATDLFTFVHCINK